MRTLTTLDGQTIKLSEVEVVRRDPNSDISLIFHMRSGMTVFINFSDNDEREYTRELVAKIMAGTFGTITLNDGRTLVLNHIIMIEPYPDDQVLITLITGKEIIIALEDLPGEEPYEDLIQSVDNLAIT